MKQGEAGELQGGRRKGDEFEERVKPAKSGERDKNTDEDAEGRPGPADGDGHLPAAPSLLLTLAACLCCQGGAQGRCA